ncbi:MAG: phosphate acyltransferase PlsX [Syntrophomonas sp.]
MKIAVDAMGGDHAPQEIVAGAIQWAESSTTQLVLVGQEEPISRELNKYAYDHDRISIVNATQIMEMNESVTALRKKQDSSIVVATRLVKTGKADAIVSCGSTGAQMAAATLILGRLEHIERPPIVSVVPGIAGKISLLLDVGANVDCRPQQMVQFALLGRVYASILTGLDNPRVALLNNGEEEGKGNTLSLETYQLLQKRADLNFIGNVEGRDLFFDKSDVVVCDGFVGNLLLKSMEGIARLIGAACQEELGRLPSVFRQFDYSHVGGAPLLGVNGISIVCHGSSKREAVFNGIRLAEQCVHKDMVKSQILALSKAL